MSGWGTDGRRSEQPTAARSAPPRRSGTGALFGIVINLRTTDAALGDTAEVTLMAQLHIVGALLILVIALVSVWQRRRAEAGRPARHPNGPLLWGLLALYFAANALLVARAAGITTAS